MIDSSTQSVLVKGNGHLAGVRHRQDDHCLVFLVGNVSSVQIQLYQSAGVNGFVGLYSQRTDLFPVSKSPFASASIAPQSLALWNETHNASGDPRVQSIGTMIHRACGFLHVPASELSPAALRGRSSRLRDTLRGLARGLSEKQLAAELRLSPHTVHDYVKALHHHFVVQSRGELLRRCFAVR